MYRIQEGAHESSNFGDIFIVRYGHVTVPYPNALFMVQAYKHAFVAIKITTYICFSSYYYDVFQVYFLISE